METAEIHPNAKIAFNNYGLSPKLKAVPQDNEEMREIRRAVYLMCSSASSPNICPDATSPIVR